jgi:hypothetical protein
MVEMVAAEQEMGSLELESLVLREEKISRSMAGRRLGFIRA